MIVYLTSNQARIDTNELSCVRGVLEMHGEIANWIHGGTARCGGAHGLRGWGSIG